MITIKTVRIAMRSHDETSHGYRYLAAVMNAMLLTDVSPSKDKFTAYYGMLALQYLNVDNPDYLHVGMKP